MAATPSARNITLGLASAASRAGDDCVAGVREVKLEFDEPKSGEWVQPIRRGYLYCCCDCALVHKMDFRVYRGRAQFRVWRDKGNTKRARKQFRVIVR